MYRYGLERLKVSRLEKCIVLVRRHFSFSPIGSLRVIYTCVYTYIYRARWTGVLHHFNEMPAGSTLQTGDVNNASAQARPFLPRRRFSRQFALSSFPYVSLRLSLPPLLFARVAVARSSCSWASGNHRLAAFSATDAALTFIKSDTQWPRDPTLRIFVRVWKCRRDRKRIAGESHATN